MFKAVNDLLSLPFSKLFVTNSIIHYRYMIRYYNLFMPYDILLRLSFEYSKLWIYNFEFVGHRIRTAHPHLIHLVKPFNVRHSDITSNVIHYHCTRYHSNLYVIRHNINIGALCLKLQLYLTYLEISSNPLYIILFIICHKHHHLLYVIMLYVCAVFHTILLCNFWSSFLGVPFLVRHDSQPPQVQILV